jgi:hypothetical protein
LFFFRKSRDSGASNPSCPIVLKDNVLLESRVVSHHHWLFSLPLSFVVICVLKRSKSESGTNGVSFFLWRSKRKKELWATVSLVIYFHSLSSPCPSKFFFPCCLSVSLREFTEYPNVVLCDFSESKRRHDFAFPLFLFERSRLLPFSSVPWTPVKPFVFGVFVMMLDSLCVCNDDD